MKAINWDALIRFVGYGPSNPPNVLFVGLEEKSRECERNLAARWDFSPIEDLRDAHDAKLGSRGIFNPFENRGNPVQQWNTASQFALALEGSLDWHNRRLWGWHWRNKLGRRDGNTFLMECFPFPRPNRSSRLPIGLPWSTPEVWKLRRPLLTAFIERCPPNFVVAYGADTKNKVEQIFSLDPTSWRRVSQARHDALVTSNGNTHFAHVGFFGRGRFSRADIPIIVAALQGSVAR